ncbi:TetR/AcrR family transcriptional regulator [Geminicoccus harenae]|uniref:TetR/AcrR family transcriptional regulator n=1 Tax=Geminicoccus harenae TaxID=2498453 RepID=UPI00168ABAD6|nr:TetR/AcrR family transcriptional regulator [Geminicoccus harenae]
MSSKRRDIAEAANRVFYREGFAAVGIDRLVDEANVALGTLYRHFGDRTQVIVAALEHRHGEFLAYLEERARAGEGADCVLQLFDALGNWSQGRGGNGCLFLRAAADHPHDERIRQAAVDHKRRYLALVEQRLLQGGWRAERAEELAPVIFLLLEGAVAAAFTLGDAAAVAGARHAAAILLAQPGAS